MKTPTLYEITAIASDGGVRFEAVGAPEPLSKETFLPSRFARSTRIKGEGETVEAAIADLINKRLSIK